MKTRHLFHGFCVLSVCAAAMLTSCSGSGRDEVTYVPFRADEDGKWGMISTEGKVLFEDEFHNVPTYVTDDRFFVQNQDGFWEMYSAAEKPERIADEFRFVTPFSNGVAIATPRNGSISIIDKDGEVKVELKKFESKDVSWAEGFCGNIAKVVCDTLSGVVDTKGNTVLAPTYSEVKLTPDGHIVAADYKYVSTHIPYDTVAPRGKQTLFDASGKELYTLDAKKYYSIVPEGVTDKYITLYSRSFKLKTEGKGKDAYSYPEFSYAYSIIDTEGNTVVAPSKSVKAILAMRGDCYIYLNEDNLTGVRKIDGTEVIKPEYNGINFIGESYFATEKDGDESNNWQSTFKLYDMEGRQVTHETYTGIAGNRNYRALKGDDVFVCSDNEEWTVVDAKGADLPELPKMYAVMPYSYGDAVVRSDEIDYSKFLKQLKITDVSMGEFTFQTRPQEAIRIQQKMWNTMYGNGNDASNANTSKPKASDYTSMSTIWLSGMSDGHDYSSEVQYPSTLSKQTFTQKKVIDYTYGNWYWYHMQTVPTGFVFNNITPSWFKMSFTQYNYYGRLRTLYKELVKYVKKWGTVDESNPGATLMTLTDGRQLLIALTDTEVFMKWGKLPTEDKWIGQYSSSAEKLQSTYDGYPYMLTSVNNYYMTAEGMSEEGDI